MAVTRLQAAVHCYQAELRRYPETTWVTPDARCLLEGYGERAITFSFIAITRWASISAMAATNL